MAPDRKRIECPVCRIPVDSLMAHFAQRHPDLPGICESWDAMQAALEQIRRASMSKDEPPGDVLERVCALAELALDGIVAPELKPVVQAREAVIAAARSAVELENAYPPLEAHVESLNNAEVALAAAMALRIQE